MQIGVPNVNMWKLKGIGCEPPTLPFKINPKNHLWLPNKTMLHCLF